MLACGKSVAASSSMRSTPGRQAVKLSVAWHLGQAVGCGVAKPQWWQTSWRT